LSVNSQAEIKDQKMSFELKGQLAKGILEFGCLKNVLNLFHPIINTIWIQCLFTIYGSIKYVFVNY
jgi:hypothetical protein